MELKLCGAALAYDRGEGVRPNLILPSSEWHRRRNLVEVCHAYTCQIKTTFYLGRRISRIPTRKVKNGDTPFQERSVLAYAIAMIEKKVGARLGIKDKLAWNSAAPAIRLTNVYRGHEHDELPDPPPVV